MPTGSKYYQSYVANLQRLYMVDFIDRVARESRLQTASARLDTCAVNPRVTSPEVFTSGRLMRRAF